MSTPGKILKSIESAVDRLSKHADFKQSQALKSVISMLKELETRGDTLLNNISNFKTILDIKARLEKVILDDQYFSELKKFGEAFNEISTLQNSYFSSFNSKFKPFRTLELIKKSAIETTVNSLSEVGVQVGVTEGIRRMLIDNTTSGGSYSDLTNQLKNYLSKSDKNNGALLDHVQTHAKTAINQFSAEYNKAISDDLGLEWYMYTGSLLTTSRPFCVHCSDIMYLHISWFPEILKGKFPDGTSVPLTKSTELPAGLMAGTDVNNFAKRRGGWNCGHQLIAVNELAVPKKWKDIVYASQLYKIWKGKKAA